MSQAIRPEFVTLQKILSDRLLRIPEYQRAYSWHSKQRQDLFEDVERLAAGPAGTTHFMATIVGLRRDSRTIRARRFDVTEIVDGQQRLTTLVILLKALSLSLDPTNADQCAIASDLQALLVKGEDASLVLLQTNHDASHHFADYLRSGRHKDPSVATTIADRELLQAMVDCESFVARWSSSDRSLPSLLELLMYRLGFILHEITDESAVYTVFEVLNTRGLDVPWFDRLKSVLMGIGFAAGGTDGETIDELHNLWRDIYACIGLRQGLSGETLRFAATLRSAAKPYRPLSEEDSVDVLRNATRDTAAGVVEVSRWVLAVAEAVQRLHSNTRRRAVTQILQARLLACAVLLRDDWGHETREPVMSAWERVTFRIYGMFNRDARTKVGDFVGLAWDTWAKKLGSDDVIRRICDIGRDFPIAQAVEQLRDADCYNGWSDELRYVLFRYEEHLATRARQNFSNEQWERIWAATVSDSVEHVLAQSKGEPARTDTGIFVHRLGNLVMLPPKLNSKLQDKDPTDKKDAYVGTGLLIARDVAARIPTWDRAAVVAREDEILSWAQEEWSDLGPGSGPC